MLDTKYENPNLVGLNTNLSNQNKWIGYFPFEDRLGKNYQNIQLHLTRFVLPQLQMGSTTVSYKGYQKEIPTKVLNAETKELTLEYFVDDKWKNYSALFKWMSGVYGTLNPIAQTSDIQGIGPDDYVPLRIYLIDNYKNKIIQFLFQNCWIKYFNDISLDVQNSGEVLHSFTVVYDSYTIEEV